MKTLLKLSVVLAMVSGFAFGQGQNIGVTTFPLSNPLVGSTTLSSAMVAGSGQACVASATGIVTPSLSVGTLGSFLFIDSEMLQVTGAGSGSTCFKVARGWLGTPQIPHPNTSLVWIGNTTGNSGDSSRPTQNNLFPLEVAPQTLTGTPTPVGAITSTASVSGTFYYTQLTVPFNQAVTGACVLNGGTVGTDNHLVAIWDYQGNVIANSAVAGALAASASLFQCFAFTAPVELAGPATYYVGVQSNGTTATLGLYVTGNAGANLPTGSVTGTFGTLKAITPVSSFTTAKGPVMTLY